MVMIWMSIVPKMSNLVIERKIAYLEVLKNQKFTFDYKESFRLTMQGLHVDLVMNFTLEIV